MIERWYISQGIPGYSASNKCCWGPWGLPHYFSNLERSHLVHEHVAMQHDTFMDRDQPDAHKIMKVLLL